MIESGIYTDMSNDDYHGEREHLSSSNLKMLLKDKEKFYKEKILGERKVERKNAFDEGNYAHTLILEPHMVNAEYAFYPGFRKSGKDWERFKDSNSDKIILSKPQKARVEKWVKSYENLPVAVELLKGCDPELSLFTNMNDVKVKVRADAINVEKGYIVDVKTTSYSSELDSFKTVVDNLNYDLSCALYVKAFSEHYRKNFDFYFVVLGKNDGMCQVFKASNDTLNKGSMLVAQALSEFKKCKESGIWVDSKPELCNNSGYEILEV